MALKASLLGFLIYATMAGWLGALAAYAFGWRAKGRALALFASAAAAAAFGARWVGVGHVPMQSLFEVFLCLALLLGPLSFLWRRWLGKEGECTDALIALAILVPAGFVFSEAPAQLPPALFSPLFIPHVAAYLLAYVILIRSSLAAGAQLLRRADAPEAEPVYRLARLGFPLLTLGLLLGAWWGKLAWGDYWNWDPKELWSLTTWVVFAGYFHLHSLEERGGGRLSAAVALLGGVCILITLLWVNLAGRTFPGLHAYTGP